MALEEKDIEDFNDLDGLLRLMKKSTYFRSAILSYAMEFYFENKEIINEDIMQNKDRAEKSQSPGES